MAQLGEGWTSSTSMLKACASAIYNQVLGAVIQHWGEGWRQEDQIFKSSSAMYSSRLALSQKTKQKVTENC